MSHGLLGLQDEPGQLLENQNRHDPGGSQGHSGRTRRFLQYRGGGDFRRHRHVKGGRHHHQHPVYERQSYRPRVPQTRERGPEARAIAGTGKVAAVR